MRKLAARVRVKNRKLRGDEFSVRKDLGAQHLDEAVAPGKDRRAGAAKLGSGDAPLPRAGAGQRGRVGGLSLTVHGGDAGSAQVRVPLGVIGDVHVAGSFNGE